MLAYIVLLVHLALYPKILEVFQVLWTIIGILIILWILGFSFQIGGGLIHLILVIAVIVLIIQLITGRRA